MVGFLVPDNDLSRRMSCGDKGFDQRFNDDGPGTTHGPWRRNYLEAHDISRLNQRSPCLSRAILAAKTRNAECYELAYHSRIGNICQGGEWIVDNDDTRCWGIC